MIATLFWLCVAAIVYAYAGYPLLLALLARLRPKPKPYPPFLPPVTLLIAAYNEEKVITGKLENSLALDYPRDRLQILVVNDGSTDRTAEILRAFAPQGVEVACNPPRRGKMAAINRAMAQVRGDIVLFSDASNSYDPDALREIVKPLADSAVGGVTGARSLVRGADSLSESAGLYWKYEAFIQRQETRLGSCTGFIGEIFALRRHLFRPAPDQIINDDFYMGLSVIRQGQRVVYAPQARSRDYASMSAHDESERRARIVAGRFQILSMAREMLPWNNPVVIWQILSHKVLRPLVPLAMAGVLLTNVLAVLVPHGLSGVGWPAQSGLHGLATLSAPFNWVLLAGQLGFYALAMIGRRVQRRSALGKLLYVPAFLVDSNLASADGLYRFISGRQSAMWHQVPRHGGAPVAPAEDAALSPD